MPGLLRGVARTAVIAGTATAVSNGVSRRQYGRWEKKAQQEQAQQPQQQQYAAPAPAPAAPAPAAESMDDKISQLKQLAELHTQGVLTDDEFAAQKAKLLG
ncbi:MAG: SHOCT domain-containing protein [Candidatus Nanopelagicales bacterium]|jgi:broad specificity phosphatase PhoE|nr:SHOCT domain-containing protein [Candidatus Nanopelagicales bacterium]